MLTLAIGDLFIPDRVVALPLQFTKLLAPNAPHVPSNSKIAQVVCLGNITQSASTLRFLHELSPALHVVRGEFDDETILSQQLQQLQKLQHVGAKNEGVPLYRVVNADNFRIGFTSGHQLVPQNDPLSLLAFAREIDVDVLVWGGTHRVEAYTLDGKFFINPGSATGAFSMAWPEEEEDDETDHETDEGSEEVESRADDGADELDQEEEEKEKKGNGKEGGEKEVLDKDGKETEEKGVETEGEKGDQKGKKENGEKNINGDLGFDSSLLSSSIPSFCLLDTNSSKCTLYIYTYVGGEVKVDKVIYSKE